MSKQTEQVMPVGIIIITHSNYGAALLQAAESILGPLSDCLARSVDIRVDVSDTVEDLRSKIDSLNNGNGVIILTDMFGGTPTNLSLSLLSIEGVEVVTGVNLPMLLRVASQRGTKIAQLAEEACAAGVQGIISAGEMLRKRG